MRKSGGTPSHLEYRTVRDSSVGEGAEGRMCGKAAPFNSETMIGRKPWGFREKIAPGAFQKSINDGDVVLLDQHDTAKPLARTSAGTLNLSEGSTHLEWDAAKSQTSYGKDAAENIRNGNYGGCSFGFEVVRDTWEHDEETGMDTRTLNEVKLHEISLVTFPAYANTEASLRSAVEVARGTDHRADSDGDTDEDMVTCPTCNGEGEVSRDSVDDDGDNDGTGGPGSNDSDMNKTPNGGAGRSEGNGPDLSTREDEARQDALRAAKLRMLSRES